MKRKGQLATQRREHHLDRGAGHVTFVVGAQKLVRDLESASERVFLKGRAGKILQIHQEHPGRIHIVLVRESVGT